MTPRVVVTGMGWITPLGHDLETVWTKLVNGESGVRPIVRFDASTFPTSFAAEVRDYDFRKYVRNPAMPEGAAMNTQVALGAARQAWDQPGPRRSARPGPPGAGNGRTSVSRTSPGTAITVIISPGSLTT